MQQFHRDTSILATSVSRKHKRIIPGKFLQLHLAKDELLNVLSEHVESNPGPAKENNSAGTKEICTGCGKVIRKNQDGVRCMGQRARAFHMNCSGMSVKDLCRYRSSTQAWYCIMCSLPPLSDSLLEYSSEDENHGRSDVEAENEIWADFDKITESHRSNFNGIGGFKLHDMVTFRPI